MAPPFRRAEFDIIFGKGISRSGDLLDLAVEHNLITKAGTYYNYGETRLGQGRENARTFLDENSEMFTELDGKIRELLVVKPAEVKVADKAVVSTNGKQ